MGISIERAAAEEAVRMLRRHGLAWSPVNRALSVILSLPEDEWEVVLRLIDPLVREAVKRWAAPVVLHAVDLSLERMLPAMKGPPPLLDRAGVARRLNVSERTVERLVADGHLVPLWVGGSRRFSMESIDSFLKRYAIRGRPSTKSSRKRV